MSQLIFSEFNYELLYFTRKFRLNIKFIYFPTGYIYVIKCFHTNNEEQTQRIDLFIYFNNVYLCFVTVIRGK